MSNALLILVYLTFIAVAGYLDYNSTMAGIKRGTTKEANPLLAPYTTKTWFIWLKIGVAAGAGLLLILGWQWNIWLLIALLALITAAYYYFIVLRNYRLSKGINS